MKENTKSVVVLTAICLVVAICLACVNYVTAPIIEEANAKAAFNACFEVMPSGENFEMVEQLPENLPATITTVYREMTGKGYAFKMTTKGYDTGLVIVCGIDETGAITGTKIVTSNETPSIGGKCANADYADQYVGKTSELEGVQGISGATRTSTGYQNAVLDAFAAYETLTKGGGSNG